jgi:phosphoadenosine phosphosulfate reductase
MKAPALQALLERIATQHSPAALASSLQAEGMVLTHAIARAGLPIEVFIIDTGRLHSETLSLITTIKERFGIEVKTYSPDPQALAEYTRQHGRDAFYDSVELRQRCCHIRKVEPLARALSGKRAWLTGLRRAQAETRAGLAEHEFDSVHGLQKFNPLAAWSEAEVWQYLRANGVPYNRLYDQGYRSIGCAPCTRPVLPGEDVRAGRWWWEPAAKRECGLHLAPT